MCIKETAYAGGAWHFLIYTGGASLSLDTDPKFERSEFEGSEPPWKFIKKRTAHVLNKTAEGQFRV